MFGILNIGKPPDVTSRDVVNQVQRLVRPAKVGHAGTLDPAATGVLLVCVGRATKLIPLLQERRKEYLAEFTLGQRSDTDDSTGNITAETPTPAEIPRTQLQSALQEFVGSIPQVPPAYSAVKVSGRRAYSRARNGEEFVLRARTVTVYGMEVLTVAWPRMTVRIECGSGTYIRSIARDLGDRLGCGGLMSRLERTAIGEFRIGDALPAASVTTDSISEHLINPLQAVRHLPHYRCTEFDLSRIKAGQTLKPDRERFAAGRAMTSVIENAPLLNCDVAFTCPTGEHLRALGTFRAAENCLHASTVFF